MARPELTRTDDGIPVLRRQFRQHAADWRCICCNRLLGRLQGHQLHVRFDRRHEYVSTLPASATCKGCGTLNRADPA